VQAITDLVGREPTLPRPQSIQQPQARLRATTRRGTLRLGGEEEHTVIDTSFDFCKEVGEGRDPDRYSPTLRRYHQHLWSKPLPSGAEFGLSVEGGYLHHVSDLGEFWLSSDWITNTYRERLAAIVERVPAEGLREFWDLGCTIGASLIFPANKIGNQQTINGARGFHPSIADRFDLTLDCIRRHYGAAGKNPLADVLGRYSEFFALFGNFRGYVEFFLLDDLVTDDYTRVEFLLPFSDFGTVSPLPPDVAAYMEYLRRSVEFVQKRNHRIAGAALGIEKRA
jgi:hypothetical protein